MDTSIPPKSVRDILELVARTTPAHEHQLTPQRQQALSHYQIGYRTHAFGGQWPLGLEVSLKPLTRRHSGSIVYVRFAGAAPDVRQVIECACASTECSHVQVVQSHLVQEHLQGANAPAVKDPPGAAEGLTKNPSPSRPTIELLDEPTRGSAQVLRVRLTVTSIEPSTGVRTRQYVRPTGDVLAPREVEQWPESAKKVALKLLLRARAANPRGTWNQPAAISTPEDEALLLELLPQSDVRHAASGTAMSFEGVRPLSLRWTGTHNGAQRLTFNDGEPLEQLNVMCRHALRVDPASRAVTVYPLDMPAETFNVLRNLGVITPSDVGRVRERLSVLPMHWKIPLPDMADNAIDVAGAPAARVIVERDQAGAGVATLQFLYQGVPISTVSATNPVEAFHLGRHYRVHRDITAEAEARRRWSEIPRLLHVPGSPEWKGQILGANLTPETLEQLAKAVLAAFHGTSVEVTMTDDFDMQVMTGQPEFLASADAADNKWLDVGVGLNVGGQTVDALPVLRALADDPSFSMTPSRGESPDAVIMVALPGGLLAPLPLARVRAVMGMLMDAFSDERRVADDGAQRVRIRNVRAEALLSLQQKGHAQFCADERTTNLVDRIRGAREPITLPSTFAGTLRSYQAEGVQWLGFLAQLGFGGVLADDMGLGKTVVSIAHICAEKARGVQSPALVIVPRSLVGQWKASFERFAPSLRLLLLDQADRHEAYDEIAKADVVITTYRIATIDADKLGEHPFSLMVADETREIKNRTVLARQALSRLKVDRKLALGGTPIENTIMELWSILDFVEPGVLGTHNEFRRLYGRDVESEACADDRDDSIRDRLMRRCGPLMLRREKKDVAKDLPPKQEIVVQLDLDGPQRDLYEATRVAARDDLRAEIVRRGAGQSHIKMLQCLLRLRQICAAPAALGEQFLQVNSCKMEWFEQSIPRLLDQGSEILVFSSWVSVLQELSAALDRLGVGHALFHGGRHNRAADMARFKRGEVRVMLVTLTAGGVGLDLPEADTVIHFDPFYNPAAENQATDRAHRIGQKRKVVVYKPIINNSIEQKILDMQRRKAELARWVFENGQGVSAPRWTEADMLQMFEPIDPAHKAPALRQ